MKGMITKEQLKPCGVTFDEDLHIYYTGDGKPLTGVTSLMKKHGLSPDYSMVPPDVLERAAERGTAVHKALQSYDDGDTAVSDATVKAYAKAMAMKGLQVIASEYLVSDNECVASCIDKVLADCSLADVKTTAEPHYDSVRWQLSIYKHLFEAQNPGMTVPHIYLIHVRNGKVKVEELKPVDGAEVRRLLECEREGMPYTQETQENGLIPLDSSEEVQLIRVETEMANLAEKTAKLKAVRDAIYAKLYDSLSKAKVKSVDRGSYKVTLVAPSVREGIDSARLKKELPEIAEKYAKTSEVKGGVRVTIKTA